MQDNLIKKYDLVNKYRIFLIQSEKPRVSIKIKGKFYETINFFNSIIKANNFPQIEKQVLVNNLNSPIKNSSGTFNSEEDSGQINSLNSSLSKNILIYF